MSGLGEINVDDWRRNTIYKEGYKDTDDIIKWFWKVCMCLPVMLDDVSHTTTIGRGVI